jgi:hypothetical protein
MATVGAGTDSVSLNAEAVAVAQTFAANCFRAVALAKYVDGLGVPGLELAGFDSADATAFQQGVDYLKTIAAIIQGNAAQPTGFDFTNALSSFIGPEPSVQA